MTHYHDYEPISDSGEALVEVCKICKKRLVTKKAPSGRIDNETFLHEHIRDFCQPTGRTSKIHKQIYGEKTR